MEEGQQQQQKASTVKDKKPCPRHDLGAAAIALAKPEPADDYAASALAKNEPQVCSVHRTPGGYK